MKKKQPTSKVSIWVSNKTREVILYHEKTKEIETDYSKFNAGKFMLSVFDVGWIKIGEL